LQFRSGTHSATFPCFPPLITPGTTRIDFPHFPSPRKPLFVR